MRIVGLETSSRRGSVALVESGQLVVAREHERPKAHAEELLPMLTRALAEAGWSRHCLDRIGVGVGPGSFTGVRIGIALAQGIAMGLGIPVVGVSSLKAMARGVPADVPGTRYCLLDARRNELFVAAYAPDGTELVAPRVWTRESALARLAEAAGTSPHVVIGEVAEEVCTQATKTYRARATDLPHAHWAAVLAGEAPADRARAEPVYVREPDATLPELPPHPLGANRQSS
jgi:tRNA threonylcarbamoyladenosine biosynthesis protein TsaB